MLKRLAILPAIFSLVLILNSKADCLTTGAPNILECAACHKLSIEEASELLVVEKFNAKVTAIKPSSMLGLWEVNLEQTDPKSGGTRAVTIYVDYGKKNLIEAKVTPLAALSGGPTKTDFSKLPLNDAPLLGNKKAKYKVAVFTDPDCPFCKRFHAEAKKVVENHKDIAFYMVLFPLPIHPSAYDKARTIACENSIKLLEDAYAGTKLDAPKCDSTTVEKNLAIGAEIGINGTPAIIFPDGTINSGYLEYGAFMKMFDRLMGTKYSKDLK